MSNTDFKWTNTCTGVELTANGRRILSVLSMPGCTDTLEPLGDGAWKWIRKSETPVTQMKMTVAQANPVTYWQVPSVNYNGNGWGSGAQYSGFGCDGEPWTYAWHRVAVPACTIAEQEGFVVGLFGEETGGMSCSIWEKEGWCLPGADLARGGRPQGAVQTLLDGAL